MTPVPEGPIRIDPFLPIVSRPARYTGGEWNSTRKDWDSTLLRVALAYPDTYEIGISHMGLQILYELINGRRDALAERTYAPWVDMEAQLRTAALPLFTVESRRAVRSFHVLGFTMPYELTYTNILNMLDLAGLPLHANQRDDSHTLVIAGGSCAFNPEPLSDFIDLFVIGDGEEVIHDLLNALRDSGWLPGIPTLSRSQRQSFLSSAGRIDGIYVPSLYEAELSQEGWTTRPRARGMASRVTKRFLAVLPTAPIRPIVPYVEAVHDRATIEIMRGCARGCRFCHAGMVYRSVRERPKDEVLWMVDRILENTGHRELGLASLSSADHSEIDCMVREIAKRHPDVSISLPSLRVDSFSVDLASAIQQHKTGFTFAPEAGSQRMRDIINKHVTADDAFRAAEAAFQRGWTLLKLYFMIGLPGEEMADVEDIAELTQQMLALGRRHHGGRAQVNLSVNTFSPKPHTPFQWVALDDEASLTVKQDELRRRLRAARVKLNWSDNRVSLLETTLAKGDRRMGTVIYEAWRNGAHFDAWTEHFQFSRWLDAFATAGLRMDEFARHERPLDASLPWDHIDCGVTKAYLKQEYLRGTQALYTPDCHVHGSCSACGHFNLDPKCMEAVRRVKVAGHI